MRADDRRDKSVRIGAAEIERLLAPSDCTTSEELVRLMRRIEICLRRRPAQLVFDLSNLRTMNTLLLSVVIHLARECRRQGVRLSVEGVSPLFLDWATTHGLHRHLRTAGILGEDESSETASG